MNKWFVIVVLILLAVVLWGGAKSGKKTEDLVSLATTTVAIGSSDQVASSTNNQLINNQAKKSHMVTIKTNLGMIELELFADKAPETVANFEKLAKSGFYNDTLFHRVIKDFMIQAGDPNTKDRSAVSTFGTGGPGYAFKDEINDVKLVRGVLAMANAGPNTNGSQFFIVTAPETPWLDGKHTAFGKVVSGMEVVDKIENAKTGAGDLPVEAVVVESISVN